MSAPAPYNLRPRETVSMRTRDGVRLDADLHRPDADGPFPVLLMRQPYGRTIASTVSHAHPSWYARHGYIVVIQDVRGRGTSEGEFDLLAQELDDGFDAVAWSAALPGATGEVGMYGFSYQGMAQVFAAASGAPALKAICPAMIAYDVYEHFAYEGGALRLELVMAWAVQLAAETARRKGDAEAHQALFAASRSLPLDGMTPARPEALERFAAYCHYDDWVSNPKPGPYWERISPKTAARSIDLPALHIGGWFDAFLPGTLACHRDWAARCRRPQRLAIGPWVHTPWSPKAGDRDYGPSAVSPIDRLQIRWFDHWLKGVDTGLLDEPPVLLYEMGGERWRAFDRWPDGPGSSRYLTSGGRAAIDLTNGGLAPGPETGEGGGGGRGGVRPLAARSRGGGLPWRPGRPRGAVRRGWVAGRADLHLRAAGRRPAPGR